MGGFGVTWISDQLPAKKEAMVMEKHKVKTLTLFLMPMSSFFWLMHFVLWSAQPSAEVFVPNHALMSYWWHGLALISLCASVSLSCWFLFGLARYLFIARELRMLLPVPWVRVDQYISEHALSDDAATYINVMRTTWGRELTRGEWQMCQRGVLSKRAMVIDVETLPLTRSAMIWRDLKSLLNDMF